MRKIAFGHVSIRDTDLHGQHALAVAESVSDVSGLRICSRRSFPIAIAARRTTNGNVHLELLHVQDKNGALAETTNGSVVLAVPSDTQADLEARCMNGNFSSELPVVFESTLRPREMHGKLGNGGVPIRLRTVNGGIRLLALRSTV